MISLENLITCIPSKYWHSNLKTAREEFYHATLEIR